MPEQDLLQTDPVESSMAIQTGRMQFLPGPKASKAYMSATPLKVKASALLWVPQREFVFFACQETGGCCMWVPVEQHT